MGRELRQQVVLLSERCRAFVAPRKHTGATAPDQFCQGQALGHGHIHRIQHEHGVGLQGRILTHGNAQRPVLAPVTDPRGGLFRSRLQEAQEFQAVRGDQVRRIGSVHDAA